MIVLVNLLNVVLFAVIIVASYEWFFIPLGVPQINPVLVYGAVLALRAIFIRRDVIAELKIGEMDKKVRDVLVVQAFYVWLGLLLLIGFVKLLTVINISW